MRNIFLYLLLIAGVSALLNKPQIIERRSKYLLGIFYNGYFKNYKDGAVYFDYMLRQNSNDKDSARNLEICYQHLSINK